MKNLLSIKNEESLNPYESLELKDLASIIRTKSGFKDISKWILIKLNKKATEEIWNIANKFIPSKGRYDAWIKLAKRTNQNISNIKHKNERKRAKSILTYALLIKFLSKYTKKYDFNWLGKNILYAQFVKNGRRIRLPENWIELGLGNIESINLRIPLVGWESISRNPLEVFRLKDFIRRIKIRNPYSYSKRKKHVPFKKIGKFYEVDFTKKVYVHLNKDAQKKLFRAFLKHVPGLNKKIKILNSLKLLDYYYSKKALESLVYVWKEYAGIPLNIILKVISFIDRNGNKYYNINWVQNNLIGVSSGERIYHKIKFPIRFQTESGIKLLTSLIGDGGLGFRSSMWAWGVPHYAQFRHKELLGLYINAVKNVFGIDIKKQEKLELPAVCGYIIVVSGYFVPGHKSYTNPALPLKKYKPNLFATCLNWLISDDGSFSQNHFSISGGCYYLNKEPLNYLKEIDYILKNRFSIIKTKFELDKDELTYRLMLYGKVAAMTELDKLFKKYNKSVFAIKKEKAFQHYLYTHKYPIKEYIMRYDKDGNKSQLERYWA